jgi:hypothetical protein
MSHPHPAQEPYDKISVNLPHSMVEKIDALASAEHRNRTSWLIFNLEKVLNSFTMEDSAGAPPPSQKTPVKYPRKP